MDNAVRINLYAATDSIHEYLRSIVGDAHKGGYDAMSYEAALEDLESALKEKDIYGNIVFKHLTLAMILPVLCTDYAQWEERCKKK